MLKLVGMILFVSGAIGWSSCYLKRMSMQIGRIRSLYDFLLQTEHAMKNEHVNIAIYMQQAKVTDETLKSTLRTTGELLEKMAVPFGEQAWENACLMLKKQWDMPTAIWENVLACKYIFFGKSLAENIDRSKGIRNRLLEQEYEQKRILCERKKLIYPVTLLLCILVILLLI